METLKNSFPLVSVIAVFVVPIFSSCKQRTFNSKASSTEVSAPTQDADEADWAKRDWPDATASEPKECDRVCPKHYYCTVTKKWRLNNPDFYSGASESSDRLGEWIPGSTICTTGEVSKSNGWNTEYEMLKIRVPLTADEVQRFQGKLSTSERFPGFSKPVFMNCKFMSDNTRRFRGCKGD